MLAGQWQKQQKEDLAKDFVQLCKYRSANAALGPATRSRVVFFGDSITELWTGNFFKSDGVNRVISGQDTTQMLGRFYANVIDLQPTAVHILTVPTTSPVILDR